MKLFKTDPSVILIWLAFSVYWVFTNGNLGGEISLYDQPSLWTASAYSAVEVLLILAAVSSAVESSSARVRLAWVLFIVSILFHFPLSWVGVAVSDAAVSLLSISMFIFAVISALLINWPFFTRRVK